MKFFHVHPRDARWLRRWLRSQLLFVVAMICLLMAMRFETAVPLAAMNHNQPDRDDSSTVLPDETERVFATRSPNPVAPEGWRRTDHGWEHVSTWPSALSRPLGEIIEQQQNREPAWIQFVLAKLREIPPLAFALLQIAAITAIVHRAKRR